MKKCITISLIFCMLLALASCGKTDTSSPENSISIDTENVEESEETEYSESEQSEYTEPEEEFITVDGSTIKNATGYHNGYNLYRVWDHLIYKNGVKPRRGAKRETGPRKRKN